MQGFDTSEATLLKCSIDVKMPELQTVDAVAIVLLVSSRSSAHLVTDSGLIALVTDTGATYDVRNVEYTENRLKTFG